MLLANTEQVQLLQSLQRCLELRDKYMLKSGQRIGDDPRDHDGHFQLPSDEHADVSGIRPDVAIDPAKSQSQQNLFEPWNIYPKPPLPHWHLKDHENVVSIDGTKSSGREKFNFDDCTIPGEHLGWSFGIDVKGVFQVYDDNKGTYKVIISFCILTNQVIIGREKKR
jgi:AMP deaminase